MKLQNMARDQGIEPPDRHYEKQWSRHRRETVQRKKSYNVANVKQKEIKTRNNKVWSPDLQGLWAELYPAMMET